MLIGFKKRFVEPIQIGTKVFTMRVKPKRTPAIGETLHMYCGLRTSNCFRISNKEKLMSIQNVRIRIDRVGEGWGNDTQISIWVDKRLLTNSEMQEFVKFDGFTDDHDFATWWLKGKSAVEGEVELYHWTDLKY